MNINKPSTRVRSRIVFSSLIIFFLALIFTAYPHQLWGQNASSSLMADFYERMANLNGYEFSSNLVQTTHPLATVDNIGLSSQTESALITGSIDKSADLTLLNVLEQDGYLLEGRGQIELKIQDGQVLGRVSGQPWEKLDESAKPEQTTNEPAAFLQATRNVSFVGTEERAGQYYERYTFELDGLAWARIMQVEIQKEMHLRGELAPGQLLDALSYYEEMTGEGELWVNQLGLPQRIQIRAVYPPLPNEAEYRELEITSDYSNWQGGDEQAHVGFTPFAGWNRVQANVAQAVPSTGEEAIAYSAFGLLLILFLIIPLALLFYRRAPKMYRVAALTITLILIMEPLLLLNAVRATSHRRETRAQQFSTKQSEANRVQEAVDQIQDDFADRFDATKGLVAQIAEADRIAQAVAASGPDSPDAATILYSADATGETDTDGDNLSDKKEAELKTNKNEKDSDGDGIEDGVEYLTLGLDPTNPDTDGDLISDGVEITGIAMGGKTWYLNPLSADTNKDKRIDTLECAQKIDITVDAKGKATKGPARGTGVCDDTDGDGTPDFADDDNDNDFVWDWLDGQSESRFGDVTNGVKENTFVYNVKNYSAGKPLRVTFELRPTNPQHLWYSRNVLDWPSGDTDGQIKRVHDTKLGTTGAEANGDMQLIPLIEVTIPAADAIHLPTIAGKEPVVGDNGKLAQWLNMDVMQRYQMAASWTADKQSMLIHLPATLIRDTRGNAPLNFVAKMLYWPNGTGLFSTDHKAKLVWMVQMDTDSCKIPTDAPDSVDHTVNGKEVKQGKYQAYCLPDGKHYENGTHWKTAKKQLVHRYYDSFFLNAFTSEEDLGNQAQIFYEKPGQIANKAAYVPDQLLAFGTVIESYLRQKKTPAEALSAYQTRKPKMASRLAQSASISDPDVFGLLSQVSTQAAPQLLDSTFTSHRTDLKHPTMLYVTSSKSKVYGLDGISTGDSLSVDMSKGVAKSSRSVRVGSFTYNANPGTTNGLQNPNWISVDPAKVWKESMRNQVLETYKALPQATKNKYDVKKYQSAAIGLYWNLARGIQNSGEIEINADRANDMIDGLGAAFDNAGENAIGAVMDSLTDLGEAQQNLANDGLGASIQDLFNGGNEGYDKLAGAVDDKTRSKNFDIGGSVLAGLSALTSVALLLQEQLGFGDGFAQALEIAQGAIDTALAVVQTVKDFSDVQKGITGALKNTKFEAAGKAATWAAVIVAAIILVIALVMFTKLLLDGDAVAAKTALAQGIAGAAVVLILFAIGLFVPIGTAISAILAILDGLIALGCAIYKKASGSDDFGDDGWSKLLCDGVAGNLTAFIAGIFYSTSIIVKLDDEERLAFGPTDTKLIEQNGLVGMSAGNKMKITKPVTATLRLGDDHLLISNKAVILDGKNSSKALNTYLNPTSRNTVLMSEIDSWFKTQHAYNYELVSSEDAATNSALEKRTTASAWKTAPGDPQTRMYKTESPSTEITLDKGINWTPSLYMREYIQYGILESGLFGGISSAARGGNPLATKTSKNDFNIGKNMFYDVFPATLTEFYTLEQIQENNQYVNRYRLAWGGTKKPFPTLVDADGDGLRSDGTGSLDPDDKTGDKDGDGLPDPFEMQDFRLDPSKADSDGDGLNDYAEIRYGTRPNQADSDNDGLNDGDEVKGWEFVYVDSANVSKRTWVTSNPLNFDTDGDGLSDQQERVLGFHPRARTFDTSVLSIKTTTNQTQSRYLGPSQSIAFTSTVKNELRKPVAYGLLEAEILNSSSTINPITFELQPQKEQAIKGTISAPATAPASNPNEITLRNRAGANMVDPDATYASALKGLAQPNGLKFQLNFAQKASNPSNFTDATGTASLTCSGEYCPSITSQTNSFGTFKSQNWYRASGGSLGFTQDKFSVGGWITVKKAFGDEYDERVIFGPDNVDGAVDKYIQLSAVNVKSETARAKIHFTATDGTKCEQVLTDLTMSRNQRTHVFVTYDGTQVHGYKNGEKVGSYNLQGCSNKTPAGNRFTIGRGASEATLYLNKIHFKEIDEGRSWISKYAEAYVYWSANSDQILWKKNKVKNSHTPEIGKKFTLRSSAEGDTSRDIIVCENDGGSRCDKSGDDDDYHGRVSVDMRKNAQRSDRWSSNEGSGQLHYNTQNNFFYGDIDDLRIYGNLLSEIDVRKMVNAAGLHYQLDESSGRTEFRNAGTDAVQLTCLDKSKCPTSGVSGYSGQAVRFTGVADQALQIQKISQRFGVNFATSFWVKPDANAASGTVSLLKIGKDVDGFTLDATPQGNNVSLNVRFSSRSIKLCAWCSTENRPTQPATGSTTIPAGKWSQITLFQLDKELRLYVDGESKQTVTARLGYPLVNNSLYKLSGNAAPELTIGNKFHGLVDDLLLVPAPTIGGRKQTSTMGGSGGSRDFNTSCNEDEAMVGVYGKGGSWLDRLGVVCSKIDSNGNWASSTTTRRGYAGGSGGNDFSRVCPQNKAISGFEGNYQNSGGVDQVRIICSSLRSGGYVDSGDRNTQSAVGGNGNGSTNFSPTYCPSDLAANGIFGRQGSRIDKVGLWCGAPKAQLAQKVGPQATSLYKQSAYVYLPFDETSGNTTFVNNTGRANLVCTDANNCPAAGGDGRVRESVLFNKPGTAPSVAIEDHRHDGFSFSLWTKVANVSNDPAALVSLHENATSQNFRWRLQLAKNNGKIVPQFTGLNSSNGESCGSAFTVTPANVTLVPAQWVHLGVSYDTNNGRNHLSLYLNGQLIHEERRSSLICRIGTALRFGQDFKGQMDEFSYYRKPIELTEFLSQYVYQNTWYDEVTTTKFKVDYDKPTVRVTANPFVKTGTNIFGVAVSDVKSGIKSVEYKDTDGTWKSATSETATAGVWAFGMNIQGNTTLEVRAIDNVGNVTTDTRQVKVDTAPPAVALSTSGVQKTLSLAGTASDSESGLQSASIMVLAPTGEAMSAPRGVTVTNGAWSFTQDLPSVVTGEFTVWMSAIDQMGNQFAGNIGTVKVDNSGPLAGLMADSFTYSGVANALPTIKGYVTDAPYPDKMNLHIGFEDQPNSGTVSSSIDHSGNQYRAIPATGTSGPSIVHAAPQHQAEFQLGQTLMITVANSQLLARGSLPITPYEQTVMAWINPTATSGEQKIWHQNDQKGYGILLKGDQVTLRINRAGTSIDKDTGLRAVAGQWQLLTVSFGSQRTDKQEIKSWLGNSTKNPVGTLLTLTGNEKIESSTAPLMIGAASNGYAGKLDDLVIYPRAVTESEARQLAIATPSKIKKVEIGFLHRKDRTDPTKVVWKEATLDQPGNGTTTWQAQAPNDVEGIYDISLRATDEQDNQRIRVGVWNGVIDTQAPRIALGGTSAGSQECVIQDFSLATATFACGDASNATGAIQMPYSAGALASANLTWDPAWYKEIYQGANVAPRPYALKLNGRDFTSSNIAENCDRYGNCTKCTVTANNTAAAACTVYSASTLITAAGLTTALAVAQDDDSLFESTISGPSTFTTTVWYESPDAYDPASPPAVASSVWISLTDPYTLVDDAVLAPTRPFAASYSAANTELDWGQSISATQYYAGWTLTETVVITDLTAYGAPGVHAQTLPDMGRYYAHVVAEDAAGELNATTLGPIYFDGAAPASYLEWDEYGPDQPYWAWEESITRTDGSYCNLLGFDDRVGIYSNNTSPRSGPQYLFGTWSNEWLALHWDGVDLNEQGDLHLYIDSKAGGSLSAYNPYKVSGLANGIVTMPERRQYQSNTTDRMLADYGVIIEDGETISFLQWNGSAWQHINAALLKFQYIEGRAIVWLPLATLELNPAAMDASLAGFVTEERAMQVWATMPGNNPLNSPEMLPDHQPGDYLVDEVLLTLHNDIRLSSDATVNNTLDNCPTNVLFEQSELDVHFMANPSGELFDVVTYEGIAAAIPDDVESLLASLCAGTEATGGPVCQLAAQLADNAGGGGPEIGPTGTFPTTVGPDDEVVFYATVRNISNQYSGNIYLDVEGDLSNNGAQLAVGSLAPLETRVISFTEVMDDSKALTEMTIYPVEEVENVEENIILTYEHEPHSVLHDVDIAAPSAADMTTFTISNTVSDNTIGVGLQYLTGLVFDTSLVDEVTLQTSLGETVVCDDTLQINAFTSDWICPIDVPLNTPDGTQVDVTLTNAVDLYGYSSGQLGTWSFEVDNTAPELELFDDQVLAAASINATSPATETLTLDGLVGDDRLVDLVEVCDQLKGYESCQEAELYFFTDELNGTVQAAAFSAAAADEAYWYFETEVERGIENVTVPYTVTAYDAYGNGSEISFELEIDTKPADVTLDSTPATQVGFDEIFSLSGSATDVGGVEFVELEVLTPLGEYVYYTATVESQGGTDSTWMYSPAENSAEFAAPGLYSYYLLAYDGFGNETEVGPFELEVGAAPPNMISAPEFIEVTDLWQNFAPGATISMTASIDDADIELGDVISVTVEPLHSWLTYQRIDEYSFVISGTVPLTMTKIVTESTVVDDDAPVDDDADTAPSADDGSVSTDDLAMTIIVEDSTGRQAFRALDFVGPTSSSTPTDRSIDLYFPIVRLDGATDNQVSSTEFRPDIDLSIENYLPFMGTD